MFDYHICKDSTLVLALHLRGGGVGPRMSSRDAVKNKSTHPIMMKSCPFSNPYIAEHVEEVSMVEIIALDVDHLHSLYENGALIYRINGN